VILGLTQRIFYHNGLAFDGLEHGLYNYLGHHRLVPIQNKIDQDFEQLSEVFDALIITGGNDPVLRRITETKLATEMLKQNKPIIGICHGAFLLTDMLGGTVLDCEGHMNTEHKIIIDGDVNTVNSYHDLQIKIPHSSAEVLAVDEEGYCEGWIDGNVAGVVWHPERMKTPVLPAKIQEMLK
jgi:gamma-glutamyl-gamma-aminobutyrate hydrolase PuuD